MLYYKGEIKMNFAERGLEKLLKEKKVKQKVLKSQDIIYNG